MRPNYKDSKRLVIYRRQTDQKSSFNNILDSSDECKPLQPKDKAPLMTNVHAAISVPELNHEELESLWNSSKPRTWLKKGWTS